MAGVVLEPSIITLHRSKLILLTNPSRRGGFALGEREWARVGLNTGETRREEILNLMENQCTSRVREIERGRVANKK